MNVTIKAPMRKVSYYHIRAGEVQRVSTANVATYVNDLISGGAVDSNVDVRSFDCAVADDAQVQIGDAVYTSEDLSLQTMDLSFADFLAPIEAGDYVCIDTEFGEGEYAVTLEDNTVMPDQLSIAYADCNTVDTYDQLDEAYTLPLCGCLDLGTLAYRGNPLEADTVDLTTIEISRQLFRVEQDETGAVFLSKVTEAEDEVTDLSFDALVDQAQEQE